MMNKQEVNDVTKPAAGSVVDAVYGNGKWVAVVDGSRYCLVSENGSQWNVVELPIVGYWSSVTYNDGRWVIISYDGIVLTSTDDARTWVKSTALNPKQPWFCVTVF